MKAFLTDFMNILVFDSVEHVCWGWAVCLSGWLVLVDYINIINHQAMNTTE